jgi:hypothetical protein
LPEVKSEKMKVHIEDLKDLKPHPVLDNVFVHKSRNVLFRKNTDGELVRTYRSWEEGCGRESILPKARLPAGKDEIKLAQRIYDYLREHNLDPAGWHHRNVMTDAITAICGTKRSKWTKLKVLWRMGLANRTGRSYRRSDRYTEQLWQINLNHR